MNKSFFLIFCISFLATPLFGQELKAAYSAEIITDLFSPDSVPNPDYEIMLDQMNFENKKAVAEIKFIVISDNKKYQVTAEWPEYLQFFETAYNLAQTSIINSKFIASDIQQKKSYYIPRVLEFTRQVAADNVKWRITETSKQINGYTAILALPEILNENEEYQKFIPEECWFIPEIDFVGGPTAYATLPGLIAEYKTDSFILKLEKVEFGDFDFKKFDPEKLAIKDHLKFVEFYKEWNKTHKPGGGLKN